MRFEKWHGLGNDFILLDCRVNDILNKKEFAIKLCDRHFGIGADGLVCILQSTVADYVMEIFNPDGSEAEMCGNAIRCVAKVLEKSPVTIETSSGIKECVVSEDGSVKVNMGSPLGIKKRGRLTTLFMGNPHAVLYVDNFDFDWKKEGEKIENNREMFPERTNVEFVKVLNDDTIEVKVWERGAGATLACGTGACASVVATVTDKGIHRDVNVELPGGILHVSWSESGDVYITGPAEKVFDGDLSLYER